MTLVRAAGPAGSAAAGLVLGYVVDAVVGDPRRGHPVAAFGRLAAALERRAYAPSRVRGTAYAALLVGGTAVIAAGGERLARRRVARVALTAAATWAVLGGRSLCGEAATVADQLERGDLAAARVQVTHLVGRDTSL